MTTKISSAHIILATIGLRDDLAPFIYHWGWVTQICVCKIILIGSDNGLSPVRRQAIIWTNAGILLIETWGIHFSEILTEINTFSFKKMHFKLSSAKWHLFHYETWKLCVTGLCEGNPQVTGGFPSHWGPITWKIFPFDDVIMLFNEGPRQQTFSESS